MRDPISRVDAKALGQTWYFTGKECPHGHIAHRWVSTGGCSTCVNENTARKRKADPERQSLIRKAYCQANINKIKVQRRAHSERNRETLNQKRREERKVDGARIRERERNNRLNNLEVNRESDRAYYRKNAAVIQERNERWAKSNREKVRAASGRWRLRHPGRVTAEFAKRRAAKLQATPKWLSKDQLAQIKAIYVECARISRETGVKHHVDHIIPLRGRNVCGLHVPWNLQILEAVENIKKGNRL